MVFFFFLMNYLILIPCVSQRLASPWTCLRLWTVSPHLCFLPLCYTQAVSTCMTLAVQMSKPMMLKSQFSSRRALGYLSFWLCNNNNNKKNPKLSPAFLTPPLWALSQPCLLTILFAAHSLILEVCTIFLRNNFYLHSSYLASFTVRKASQKQDCTDIIILL